MSDAAYALAKDISDTLTKMERLGTPAHHVVVPPDLRAYGELVASLRQPSLQLHVMRECPPGQLFLMADRPGHGLA